MFTDQEGKQWYKGNLHMHTTCSDGQKTPEEAVAVYREKGYDFLALTDHWHMGKSWQEEGFLMLSGAEYDNGADLKEGIYHIVGVGMEREPQLEKTPRPKAQTIIDSIREAGGMAILAHPAWSMNRAEQAMGLKAVRFITPHRESPGTAVRIPAFFWMTWQIWDVFCPAWRRTMPTTIREMRPVPGSWCRPGN